MALLSLGALALTPTLDLPLLGSRSYEEEPLHGAIKIPIKSPPSIAEVRTYLSQTLTNKASPLSFQ